MGQLTARQTGRRAALDAQAAYRRERQERDRRIDALAGKFGARDREILDDVRSGKSVIERGDGPPSTVKDRKEDRGAPVCALRS